ncbi:carboxy terminal-processing peptidase [Agarilytica rhodophyticola]|uniref:carboxy terminal-processing peptidase n=1 Tax=Agarilytica rhodophyticola TaxID=1737490 RepID=UPI001FEBF2CE|nr:carboxy terminal-processing peptidase [Agarilytica rhodophyticola]
MMIKKQAMVSWVIGLTLSVAAVAKPVDRISATKSQSDTIRDILSKLQSRHYREMRIDDTLSANYLDNYLDTLDPSRMFFYDKDIKSFKQHEAKFDDYFKTGNLQPAFEIYHLYRQRIVSRLESVLELLKDPTVKFDFTKDEEVLLERDEEAWPSSLASADKLWHKRVKLSLLNLKMSGKTVEEAKDIVTKRYKRQLKRVEQEDTADIFETIANSLTLLYDPHTNYWSPRTSENFNINMRLSLEGIGAVLQSEDEYTKVVRLVAGGPADKQGQLKPSDRISGVAQGDDGEVVDVVGWRLEEVVDLIRGPKNTVVKLQVTRADAKPGDNKIIRINRGRVKLEDQAAQKEILELSDGKGIHKLGIINLPTFYVDFDAQRQRKINYKSSSNDVAKLVRELMKENVDGIILDLRNNGGGSLQEAVNLTDLFIDQGPVVQIRNPDDRINRHNRSRFKALYDGPLIVLVNRLSASASEIFAGAIQDYNRGLIVGAQTFGKGTVQSVNPLIEGGLKITESKFYRVSGDSTQHRGVIPDISIPFLIDPEEVGESAYDNALPWDQIHPVPHSDYFNFSSLLPMMKSLHKERANKDPDFTYLLDQVKIMEKNRERKTISLNEKQRVKEKEDLELEAMRIENKRRLAKNLEVFKTIEAYRESEKEEEEKEESAPVSERNKIDVDGDAILIETGSILLDMIRLQSKTDQQTASVR